MLTHTSIHNTKELSLPAYLEMNFDTGFRHLDQLFQSENTVIFMAKILDVEAIGRAEADTCILKYSRSKFDVLFFETKSITYIRQ